MAEERHGGGRAATGRLASLGWRILLWTALVAFLPLLIMTSQGYHCARQAIYESQEAHLLSVLQLRQAQLENWLAERRADLQPPAAVTSGALEPIFRDRAGLGEAGRVYVLSGDGKQLWPPESGRDWPEGKGHVPAEIRSGKSTGPMQYSRPDGEKVLGASSLVPRTNWVLVAEIDRGKTFGWLARLRLRALATGVVTLILVLIVAAKGAGRLSQPLRELAAVSRRIADGHHEERLGMLEGAEAQEVAGAFNAMLDELAAGHRRLLHVAALAAVGELSASIVHEMRNPLSSVKINLQALRRKVEGDAAYAELAEIACEQVARLEGMLADLLNYGKPLQLKAVGMRFEDLARDVLEVVRREAEGKAVSLEVEDNLGPMLITVDGEQMRRALTNLLSNAIQAVGQGGKVQLRAAASDADAEKAVISVADNGPGIPEAQRERLFQPFFTTRPGGTGLGLANVKKIVELHGGTISAANRPQGGAVFTMVLPRGGPPI